MVNSDNRDPRTTAQLFTDLSHEMTDLIRHEMALAKTELSEKASKASKGMISLSIGGLVAYAGLVVLLFAVVYGLSNVMEPWLAAVVVGGVVLIIGVALLQKGRNDLKPHNLALERSVRSVRADKTFAKEHVR